MDALRVAVWIVEGSGVADGVWVVDDYIGVSTDGESSSIV